MLKPVKRQSLSDAVFEQLLDQIVGGQIGPGVELPAERALCESLGVNRGALREALKRLEQARLVTIQHGGGTRVLDYHQSAGLDLLSQLLLTSEGKLNIAVARGVVEMRAALAPDIARLAAIRGKDALADRIDEIVVQMKDREGDLPELQRLAMEFWSALVQGSDNLAYRLAYNTMREVYTKIMDLLTDTLREELTYLAGYRAVAAAIRAGDATKAEKKAREIIQRGSTKLLEVMDAIESYTEKRNEV
jgi:GntR family transcriptional regulator, transcriptional repressor for pyruvate dehydrogenase complex